ncbi:hypothetical protein N018_11490 [Pseudomonas syringae CC1557]|uniref:Uncharacterized protein n=1 Tax=Pseudomonas syringae CC1557 TaxID=1357279 RepID=W0N2Q4_PSESX|nr:hypothetical protein N018_11490 [Pseudomonas syringae CC1557]
MCFSIAMALTTQIAIPWIGVRAKEPDEVGPETEPGGLVTLAPSK